MVSSCSCTCPASREPPRAVTRPPAAPGRLWIPRRSDPVGRGGAGRPCIRSAVAAGDAGGRPGRVGRARRGRSVVDRCAARGRRRLGGMIFVSVWRPPPGCRPRRCPSRCWPAAHAVDRLQPASHPDLDHPFPERANVRDHVHVPSARDRRPRLDRCDSPTDLGDLLPQRRSRRLVASRDCLGVSGLVVRLLLTQLRLLGLELPAGLGCRSRTRERVLSPPRPCSGNPRSAPTRTSAAGGSPPTPGSP